MAAAGLLHNISSPDSYYWLTAEEVLHAATMGGAYSVLLEDEIGSLEAGKKADLVILDMRTANFMPLNDVRNHLVYCENGASVEKVIVDGEVVVEDDRLTRIDETEIMRELHSHLPDFRRHHAQIETLNRVFEPYFEEMCRRCAHREMPVNRYGAAPSEW